MRILRVHVFPPRTSCLLVPALSGVLLLAMAPPVHAEEPPVFAIANARIITVAGPVLEKGTVIVRNGIIEAVGTGIAIPADARVIDGTGMAVYPGLIDALSDAGLEESRPQITPAASQPPGTPSPPTPSGQPQAQSPDERQGLTPYRQAVEMINPAHRKIEAARAAGITTALVAPRGGIFAGQGSLINLSGGDLGRMVVKTPVAFHIQLARGSGVSTRDYPGSLMGIIAFVKQTLLDAGRYGTARSIYNANPGSVRPQYSRALESLQPLIRRESCLVLPADDPAEIQRALDLADRFELDLFLSGGAEAKDIAPVLKERNIPVLLSVRYPERDREADPEMKEELEVLRRRAEAPANAAALAKAGVRFAFQSGDVADFKDFIRNVGKAVEAGLDKETALRALTLTPAEIFGVADRLGSIEINKTANLIVTTGDIFDARTKVKIAFVDGRKFDIAEPEATSAHSVEQGLKAAGSPEVAGPSTHPADSPRENMPARVIAIKDATILTVSHGNIQKGSILVRDGKIAEIGPSVMIPAGTMVFDAAGQFVMPGIIDPHSHLAQGGGVNEGTLAVTSMTSVEDTIDATDIDIYRELAGGVTTTATLHGSANPIGGQGAVIKLRWGKDAAGLLFKGAKPGLKFALGENPKRIGRGSERYPETRMGVEDVIRQAFVEARNYLSAWEAYGKRITAGDKKAIPPRKDLKLEPIAEVLRGERLAFVHAYRADEMLMMMRVADEFGFKVNSFEHALEGYKIAKELSAHGVVASTFSDWWAYKVEAYDAIPYNAALLTRKGVMVSLNSDSAEEARHLNQEAAKCMKYGGLNEQEALSLVTINPAKQLGIDDRVGSIDPGKDADLVIYSHHPLSVYAVPQKVLIDGKIYFDIQKDLEMRKRMEQERKKLEEQEKRASEGNRPAGSQQSPDRAPQEKESPRGH